MSQTFEKIAKMNALVDEMKRTLADIGERLDRVEKEDRKRAAMQKFIESVPINGAQHAGLYGVETTKGTP